MRRSLCALTIMLLAVSVTTSSRADQTSSQQAFAWLEAQLRVPRDQSPSSPWLQEADFTCSSQGCSGSNCTTTCKDGQTCVYGCAPNGNGYCECQ
jgi:hypothetical protein